ncbi:hypothetical protein GCM10027273_38260 [Nocardioides pakistanensis]
MPVGTTPDNESNVSAAVLGEPPNRAADPTPHTGRRVPPRTSPRSTCRGSDVAVDKSLERNKKWN